MFFDDEDLGGLKRNIALRVPPPVPDTGWKPPSEFPNLSGAAVISIDTETKEPDFDHGPGWGRGKGHIVGFSLAAQDRAGNRGKWYFPVRHEVDTHDNLDPATCFRWLKAQLETPHIPKVGANLIYDVGWLTTENIYTQGDLHDVQFAEALIDNDAFVALEILGQKYARNGKETELLYTWLSYAYGGSANSDQRANIYRAPPKLVGFYGEQDADLPLTILEKQWPILHNEDIFDLYRMECEMIPLLVRMRLTGVQIDLNVAEQLYGELNNDIKKLYHQLYEVSGIHANVNSSDDLAKIFDKFGIAYPRTAEGKPSFRKEWLTSQTHSITDLVNSIREHEKIRGTFVKSYLLESNVNGRVHCTFHPLKSDENGTLTGRFASSDPNLQNIPVRSALGKRVRKAFIPDYGHVAWEKNDHSQIEYRMLAHNAVGTGSDELRATYNSDPRTDYHNKVFQAFCPFMGWDYATMPKEEMKERRRPIKNVNFGLIYGQSEKSLAYKAGLAADQAKGFFKAYHEAAPFVRPTMKSIAKEVQMYGFVTTILKRRIRFNHWEPIDERKPALPYEIAVRTYGTRIKRAGDYRGVNYKLQGSAADVLKKGMHKCFKDGVFDVIGVPKLQVHDELDFSVIDDSPRQQEAYSYMRHVLETATPGVSVPLLVDHGRGPNWGSID